MKRTLSVSVDVKIDVAAILKVTLPYIFLLFI